MNDAADTPAKLPLLSRLTVCHLNPKRWFDYLFLFLIGAFPTAYAWWVQVDGKRVLWESHTIRLLNPLQTEDGKVVEELFYLGFQEKTNFIIFAALLPATLLLLRWAINRIAPVVRPWPVDRMPPIVELVDRERSKQSVYEALRSAMLAPRNFAIAFGIVALIHVADMGTTIFPTFLRPEWDAKALVELGEKDAMYLFLSEKPGQISAEGTGASRTQCAILTAGCYLAQFATLVIGVLFAVLILSHNIFFLGRVYQRRRVPAGEEANYFRIDLDDVNRCFGFRRANSAFNPQVGILVVAGVVALFSRVSNVVLDRLDQIPEASLADKVKHVASGEGFDPLPLLSHPELWFQDVGQVAILLLFLFGMLIFTMPTLVKHLPLLPGKGKQDAYQSISGYLREYLSDEDWPYDERPNEAEIDELAGRFAVNAFWPTGDNRARRLFMYCFWVLIVILVPFFLVSKWWWAFLIASGLLAALATWVFFFGMRRSLAYIDERLVRPPRGGSQTSERKWHKDRVDVSVFISYRRSDAAAYAGRLHDHLAEHIGKDRIFMDIEAIAVGSDFIQAIEQSLAGSDAVLVLIGSTWASTAGADGQPRLSDPGDFVRLEVATALERGMEVIPVLVGGASMAAEADLPEALSGLCRLNAIEISDTRWNYDVSRLVEALKRIAEGKEGLT